MALARVNASSRISAGTFGSGILTQTVAPSVTANGRLLVFTTHFDDNGVNKEVNTPTDTQGNTYTKAKTNTINTQGGTLFVTCWSAVMGSTGANTVTVTTIASGTSDAELVIACEEFAGADLSAGTAWIDGSATAAGQDQTSNDCPVGTTAATTANGQIAVTHVGDTGSGATWNVLSGGFTRDANAFNTGSIIGGTSIANKPSSSGTAETCIWTCGNALNSDCGYIIVMKAASPTTFIARPSPRINQTVRRSTYY